MPGMSGRPFYGWVVLASAFAIISMSIGTLFTLGVFLKPIEDSMGWSRSSIGAISLLNWIVMGAGGLVAGYLSDRFGTRRVVLVGGALLGGGLVLSAHVTAAWQFYLSFGVLVGGGVSCFYVPLTVSAIRWFEDRRGMAAALVSAGNGFGILVLSPLTRWLINTFDWRTAFWVLGDLAWLVVIPAALLLRPAPAPPALEPPMLLRGSPRPHESAAGSAGRAAAGPVPAIAPSPSIAAAGSSAMRSWPFWAIALTHFGCCAAHSGPIFHMVSHAIDQGVPGLAAATLLGASGLASIMGRVVTGVAADRWGAKQTLLAALGFQALMVSAYLFASSLASLYTVGLLFGIAYGAAMPLYPLLVREYFGERAMGTVYGAVFMISCAGMGLGSWAGGAIHDTWGSYHWLFVGSFAIGGAAAVLGLGLRRPRPEAHAAAPAAA
jgi:MFS family permease